MNCRRSFVPNRFLAFVFCLVVAACGLRAAQSLLYLHSISTNEFLDANAPVGTNFQTASSGPVDRTNFVEVGTWAAVPSPFFFELTGVGDLQLWLGRRFTDPNGNSDNSGDTGTFFDLRAEILQNGGPNPDADGLVTFIRGVKADPDKATPVTISFSSVSSAIFSKGDVLSLQISARVSDYSGMDTAPGASLFYDSADRSAEFAISFFVIPEISISNASVKEGDSGTTNATLAVTLSLPAERPVGLTYSTTNGTATTADSDYVATNGALTFAAGETNKTLTVQAVGDTILEADETFTVNLSNPSNGVLAASSGTVTILNDDPAPSLSINNVALLEGNSGTTNAVLTITLTGPTELPASVNFATADGTATVTSSDYVPTNGVVTFQPGETNKTISVAVIGDRVFEPDETLFVNLTSPTNATVATPSGTVTILNDDASGPAGPTITSLPNLVTVNSNHVTVVGNANALNPFVEVNGIAATVSNGVFSANVSLHEGNNNVTVVVTDGSGQITTTTIQVTVDTTPPNVTIDTPRNGAILSDAQVDVTGLINDIVVGTVGPNEAQVQVNGLSAVVANRTYAVTGVPLVPGTNTITALGTDRAGNTNSYSIRVFYNTNVANRIQIVSGNRQIGQIGQLLPLPLVVQATDTNGNPCVGKKVIFKVIQNDGLVISGTNIARALIVTSDVGGLAQALFQLGTRAGIGNNQVSAKIVGFEGEAIFCASSTNSTPGLIVLDTGNNQVGMVGQPLPKPFAVAVVDSGFNRLPNIPIAFTVTAGGGSFNGPTNITVTSDSNGRSVAFLTLGPNPGNDNNQVQATFSANTGLPVTFVATAMVPGDPDQTSVSGVVLDNSDVPVPGATVRIVGDPNAVLSDTNGYFQIRPAPVGAIRLIVDGATVTRPGSWVWLQFDLVTIAGQDNTIGRPVRLMYKDLAHGMFVDAAHGGTLTLPQVPGFSLTILSNSVTFPDGTHSGLISATVVHPDKMPDPPEFGQQPRFLVTIQPANALFNPPAPLCIPNLDGLRPGQKTEMYSYDHDIGQFVAIGTGTVSGDGSQICSDPGVGVVKAGWHCGGNPAPPGSTEKATVQITTPGPIANCFGGGGSSVSITASGDPSPAGSPPYAWISSDESVARITGGGNSATVTVEGQKAGKATLTVVYRCKSGQPSAPKSIDVSFVEVKSITVTSGASQNNITGSDNWAAVKKSMDDVVVEVTLDPNTDDAAKAISWAGGGQAVAGNPRQRKVPKGTSAKTTVTASCGASSKSLNVWILWGTANVQMTGTTPANAVQYGGAYDGTEDLGPKSYNGGANAVGKVVPIAQLTPAGVHDVVKAGWTFHRDRWSHDFSDGAHGAYFDAGWTDDTSLPAFQNLVPDTDDKIYDRDAPNVGQFDRATACWETYNNFREFIDWNGDTASDYSNWSWKAKWQAGATPEEVILKVLSTSHLTLPSAAQGCP